MVPLSQAKSIKTLRLQKRLSPYGIHEIQTLKPDPTPRAIETRDLCMV